MSNTDSRHTSIRATRDDAETLRRVTLAESLERGRRISITDALSLVIEAARPHLKGLDNRERKPS